MSNIINVKIYPAPKVDMGEILRYAGCRGETQGKITALVEDCINEVLPILQYKLCYITLDKMNTQGSKVLEGILSGCDGAIVFAATLGVELDRLITKYGKLSPARAVVLQAIGAERIESLCNTFCAELKGQGMTVTQRVSPGYGDIPLSLQREIFTLLDCPRKIGLTLNQSLLMSPSKSVTAIMGVGKCTAQEKCSVCNKTDCLFRR